MNPLKTFFNIVEIRTKLVSMATFGFASVCALMFLKQNSLSFPLTNWLLMLFAILAVDMGTTGFNTYFDFLHGVDRVENNFEEAKVLVHQGVSPAQAFFCSVVLFFIAIVLGLIISIRTSWLIAFLGAGGMFVGFFYSAGPRPLSATPLGEFFSGGFLGCMLFCISWFVLTDNFSLRPFLYSVPISLMISGILTTNNNCDLENDKIAGRKTVSILIGKGLGEILLYAEYILSVTMVLLMQFAWNIFPRGNIFISVFLIIVMLFMFAKMKKRGFSAKTKGPSMEAILKIFFIGALFQIYPIIIWVC